MWEGSTVAILASGPSMCQAVADKVRDSGLLTVVINTTCRLALWADLLHAADERWWLKYHDKDARSFKGLKSCCEDTSFDDVMTVLSSGSVGFDDSPFHVRSGGNSGYSAIHIAAHAGASRILLFGYDAHSGPDGEQHWHGRHPEPLRNAGDGIYERWLEWYVPFAAELNKRGVAVLNCTPNSALRVWPCMSFEEALCNVS